MVSFPKRYQYHQIGTPPSSGQSRHHRLPLILPYPPSPLRGFSTSSTSHPNSFHSFILWASSSSPNPSSFPISGLARFGVKPRLRRSSWRAFASFHPLMLFSTCSREALLTCSPFPPWILPSITVESTLPTPCSRSDLPLSRQGAALAHLASLPPHDLVLWTDGSVPFPFGKGGSGVLAICSPCGTEATFSFSAGPVCSSFFRWSLSHSACSLLVSAAPTSLPFLFSYYLTLVLF